MTRVTVINPNPKDRLVYFNRGPVRATGAGASGLGFGMTKPWQQQAPPGRETRQRHQTKPNDDDQKS
jgi:hypothetical protein